MISRSPWRSAKPDEYASQALRCLRTEVTDGPVVLNGNVFFAGVRDGCWDLKNLSRLDLLCQDLRLGTLFHALG